MTSPLPAREPGISGSSRGPIRSRHWQHDAGIKIPRGQDVELMLTEGALLFERAARSIRQPPGATRPAAARTALNALARRLRDRSMPPWDRLAAAQAPQIATVLAEYPLRDLVTRSGWHAGAGRAAARPVRVLVRVLPALRGRAVRPDGPPGADLGDAAHRRPQARGDRRHGVRRRLPAARAPDRDHVPQGAEQHPGGQAGRSRLAVGDRRPRGRARRHPPRPRHVRGLRRVRRPGQEARPRGGDRPGAAGLARPPLGQGAPGVVHHPGRRDDRLRGEPAQEVPGHLPDQLRQRPRGHLRRSSSGSSGCGWATASASSGWTTRTPSRSGSGSGCSPASARPTPTCCSWPRRSPARR